MAPKPQQIELHCLECGITYTRNPSHAAGSRFHNTKCKREYYKKHPFEPTKAGPRRGAERHIQPGYKRPADGRCRFPGCEDKAPLGLYNQTNMHHYHTARDPEEKGEWHPDGVKDSVSYSNGLVW